MNESVKVLFVYNPSSGKKQVLKNIDLLKKEFIAKYGSCDIVESKSKEHFQSTIYEASKTYDYVFFSGGDGTFNMAINSLPDTDHLPIFGYIPAGSTNDMAYNLNISKNIKKGIYDILNAKPKEYSIGRVGNINFIYTCVFGAFVEVCNKCPSSFKNKYSKLGYLIYALKYFNYFMKRNFRTFKIIINGEIYETPFVIISNSKEVAGLKIKPFQKEGDSTYYICIVNDGKVHGFYNLFCLLRDGVEKSIRDNRIKFIESTKFEIDTKYTDAWDVDGEPCKFEFPTLCGFSGRKIKVLSNRD